MTFHVAAKAEDWGDWDDFRRVNVEGTKAVLAASRAAGVRRVVHVGTEAALMHGQPLVHADERTPLALSSKAPYPATKAAAEAAVVAANGDGLETIVIRPRFVWGPGDTTLLPVLIELIRSGRFRWIGGGGQRTSTTHLDNTVEGLVLAADRGTPGAAYFVTDGAPVVFREFVTALLATRGVEAPGGSIPRPLAAARGGGRRDRVARAAAPGHAAGDAVRRLGQRARVHARRLARPRRPRLRAGRDAGGRAGGAQRRLMRSNRPPAVVASRWRTRAPVCLPNATNDVGQPRPPLRAGSGAARATRGSAPGRARSCARAAASGRRAGRPRAASRRRGSGAAP